jgi:butyrate kinase
VSPELVLAMASGPGATELALFRGGEALARETALHAPPEPGRAPRRGDALALRAAAARAFLARAGVAPGALAAVAGRCGGARGTAAGARLVDDEALRQLDRDDGGAALAARLARAVGAEHGCPAFLVDAPAPDDLDALARFSGLAGVQRRSACDALAIHAAALRHARSAERPVEELSLLVAYLGAATSIAAVRRGAIVDVAGPLDDGPFSGGRCGALGAAAVVDLCFAAGADRPSVERRLYADGGLFSYLGTRDPCEAARRAERGDARALVVMEAMAYQVAKSLGMLAAVLAGEVDAVVVAGPAAAAAPLVTAVCRRVEWIAPVFVQEGEAALAALADAALRALALAHARRPG